MQTDVRPPDNDKIYYVITLHRDGLLTLRLPEHRQAVLVFTSEPRAKHYLTEVRDLDLEGEIGAVHFSANDWVSFVQSWIAAGMTNLVIDKCPYCETYAVFELHGDVTKDDWVRLCATVKATRILQYNFHLDEATRLLADGDVRAARRIGEHIVTYIDAERPEVHLLLARCGIASEDTDLVLRKRVVLAFFGPEWLDELERLQE